MIQLYKTDNNKLVTHLKIPSRTIQTIKLKISNFVENESETFICPFFQINESLTIPQALVTAYKNANENYSYIITTIRNIDDKEQEIKIEPITLEPYNPKSLQLNSIDETNPNEFYRYDEVMKLLRTDHLNIEEEERLRDLCAEHLDIFYIDGDRLTFTNEIKHQIDTGNARPIATKSYRYPVVHKEEVKKQVNKMLDDNIIRPSVSPWSAPVWVVPKKADASGKQKWRSLTTEN